MAARTRRAEVAALRVRLAEWLAETRREQHHELCAGVVARTARLGDHLVIHESGPRAHGLLMVADARSGDLVFLSEWHPPSGAVSTPIAKPEALATICRDLNAVTTNATLH
jgi:hypothetical protein